MTRRGLVDQPSLLEWQAPEPTVRFADADVRSATVNVRIAKGIATALRGHDRDVIARRMSDFLGRPVSKNMIDGYASVARDDHVISTPRFLALLHATGDRRLLELLAEPLGWAVVDRKHLPLIQVAAIREQEDELRRKREALQRQARQAGGF